MLAPQHENIVISARLLFASLQGERLQVTRLLASLALVLLAGCAAYHAQPLHPAESEAILRARSVTDAGLKSLVQQSFTNRYASWPPEQFDLEALTLVALYFHPDMAVARARLAGARAAEVTAGARPNPTVSILPTYVVDSFADETPWMFGVSFDVPIETAGKRGHRLDQARQTTLAARLALAEAGWNVRSRLRAALVEFWTARAELETFQNEAELSAQLSALLEQRMDAGDISRFDLTLAQSAALNSKIAVHAAATRLADARIALAAALGLPAAALDQIPLAWPEFETPRDDFPEAALQDAGLLNRLDVRRALAEYAALEAALQLEVAKQYPDIHLDPGYEFDQGQHKFSLGPSLTLPLLDRNQGPIAEAVARRDEAAAAFLALQSDVIHQTEKAGSDYRSALAEWKETDGLAAKLQQSAEKSAEQQAREGESDRVALLQARLQSADARRARLESLRRAQDALGALEDAAQRPLSEESDWRALSHLLAESPPSASTTTKGSP